MALKIPTVRRSCCCCTLRTGSLVIASLGIVGSIGSIILEILVTLTYGKSTMSTLAMFDMVLPALNSTEERDAASDYLGSAWADKVELRLLSGMGLGYDLGCLILAAILIHGIRRKRPMLLIPWLGVIFVDTISMVVTIFAVPLELATDEYRPLLLTDEIKPFAVFLFVSAVVASILDIYFFVVVYSYYRKLKDEVQETNHPSGLLMKDV